MRSILKTLGGVTLAMVVLTGCSPTQATTAATDPADTTSDAASAAARPGASATGVSANADAPTGAAPEEASSHDCVAGWEGWWNAIPVDGNDEHLPRRTVTVLTDTGTIIDAFDRDSQAGGSPEDLGIDYQVQEDPDWPSGSAVVIDVDTDRVIETITIAEHETVCDAS